MAETLVETALSSFSDVRGAIWGPYWSDKDTGVIVFCDAGNDLSYTRTINGGATWATTEVRASEVMAMAVWYDKETPGDDGALLHITWADTTGGDFVYYITLDVATNSLGTLRTVDGTVTISFMDSINRIAITKTVNGNIIVAFDTGTDVECYKSADLFATAGTAIANVFEGVGADWALLFPADVDDGDACALYIDRTADEISLKMYDDSEDSWTEIAIAAMVDNAQFMHADGVIRHSDRHLLIAFHSNSDNIGDDLLTYDLTVNSIASPTITAKTNVFTGQNESALASMFINQQNDDVYFAYVGDFAWQGFVDVIFHISDDGMATWGAEQTYSEQASDDFRIVHAGRSVGSAGGRYQPSFYDDDEVDLYVNLVNDIEFVAAVVGIASQRLKIGVGR